MITQTLINKIVEMKQQGWKEEDIAESVDDNTIGLVMAILRLSRPTKRVEVLH